MPPREETPGSRGNECFLSDVSRRSGRCGANRTQVVKSSMSTGPSSLRPIFLPSDLKLRAKRGSIHPDLQGAFAETVPSSSIGKCPARRRPDRTRSFRTASWGDRQPAALCTGGTVRDVNTGGTGVSGSGRSQGEDRIGASWYLQGTGVRARKVQACGRGGESWRCTAG